VRQPGPYLTGTLRQLTGPQEALPGPLDLDTLNRREFVVGPGMNVDLRLFEPDSPTVRLVARREGASGEVEVVLSREQPLQHRPGRPAHYPQWAHGCH
jgi:hypothetical protein